MQTKSASQGSLDQAVRDSREAQVLGERMKELRRERETERERERKEVCFCLSSYVTVSCFYKLSMKDYVICISLIFAEEDLVSKNGVLS